MKRRERNTTIDLMRIIGASLIIFHHYQQGTGIVFQHIQFFGGKFNFGYVVEMFFMISGMMAYGSIIKAEKLPTIRDFGGKIVRRIVPLLTVSVIVEALLRYIYVMMSGDRSIPFDLLDIIVNATGTNWGIVKVTAINQPTWYISALLICYIIMYVAVWTARRLMINANYLFVTFMIIGVAAKTYEWESLFIDKSLGRGYFSFFAGALLVHCIKEKKNRIEWLILSVPIVFLVLLKYRHEFVESGSFIFYTCLLWMPILYIAVRWVPQVTVGRRVIELLGRSSFGVYIWNESLAIVRNMVALAFGVELKTNMAMSIFTLVNWMTGIGSYLLIEKRLSNVLKKVDV